MNNKKLNTWIEISESAYAYNMAFFKKMLPKNTELSVVIKSNAYGHGMIETAKLAIKYKVDSFCVHSLEEALDLRINGITQDILIMGPVLLSRLDEAIKNDFRLVVYNMEHLTRLLRISKKTKKKVRIHLKLETGTHRQGVTEEDLALFLKIIAGSTYISLESIYTHYANIEDTTIHDYARFQMKKFTRMREFILNSGFKNVKAHTACSAATLLFPETYFDMVRIGISQYGLWPSKETLISYKTKQLTNNDLLRSVLSWKTRIAQIKKIQANQYIGYGCTYKTTRTSKIAILPVGYADGYDRGLSNQSYVLVHGKRAPLRGRICMNLLIVDITDIPDVKLEDEVVLIGQQDNESITADYLAGLIGTINYEIVTRINWNIPRIVVN